MVVGDSLNLSLSLAYPDFDELPIDWLWLASMVLWSAAVTHPSAHVLPAEQGADLAMNGREGVEAVAEAIKADDPYNLICLDIMMPEMDGQEALRRIRKLEQEAGLVPSRRAKVMMTTAQADRNTVLEAISAQCDYFLVKPVDSRLLLDALKKLSLIS